jgi:hypothetical protein
MLLARGDPGDPERAWTLLSEALESARGRGYALVERRALQALESLAGSRVL